MVGVVAAIVVVVAVVVVVVVVVVCLPGCLFFYGPSVLDRVAQAETAHTESVSHDTDRQVSLVSLVRLVVGTSLKRVAQTD